MAARMWTRPSSSGIAPSPLSRLATFSSPPSLRKRSRQILALISVFFSLGWLSLAQAAEPQKPPQYDGQLLLLLDQKGRSNIQELDQDKAMEIPFRGGNLEFYYGVKRDSKAERRPGAIIVKVVYLYDSGQEDIKEWAKDTELYRSPFPNHGDTLDSAIRCPYYVNYHQDKKDNLFLIHSFHAIYRDGMRTDGTPMRKREFLFTTEPQWNPQVRRQRTFLLYYSGVDDPGTWIPFEVGITSQMSNLLITVVDLGQPGADLVDRRWPISKKK